jgi:hypothetical protein
VLAVDAPPHFGSLLDPWPEGAVFATGADGEFDVIIAFIRTADQLEPAFKSLTPRVKERGGFWISWPKKASPLYSPGLTEETLRQVGLPTGLVDNKVCAIDEDWSGLRFVRRLAEKK